MLFFVDELANLVYPVKDFPRLESYAYTAIIAVVLKEQQHLVQLPVQFVSVEKFINIYFVFVFHIGKVNLLFLNLQPLCCLPLVLVHHFGVYLCGADVLVGWHLADDVDVSSGAEEQGGVGVAEAVECDVFFYACVFYPSVEFSLYEGVCKAFEDLSLVWFAAEFKCFVGDWK